MKKNMEVSTKVDEKALAIFNEGFPSEETFDRVLYPRISFASQDVTEEVKNTKTGKKEIKVLNEAGTFFTEKQGDEEEEYKDEDGKTQKRKVWEKIEIGSTLKGVILFERKQLRYYDEGTEKYTSSPIYDTEDQIVPLFRDKEEVDRGTPAELQHRKEYDGLSQAGKFKSKLEVNRILYILYKGEVYQLGIRGTSMYAYLTYRKDLNKKGLIPPAIVTQFMSEPQTKGKISWNQMTFEMIDVLTGDDMTESLSEFTKIKESIDSEKAFYASQQNKTSSTAVAVEGEEKEDDY